MSRNLDASDVDLSPADSFLPPESAVLNTSLLPAKAPESALVVGEDDIRLTRGPRSYRVRGLARNLSCPVRAVRSQIGKLFLAFPIMIPLLRVKFLSSPSRFSMRSGTLASNPDSSGDETLANRTICPRTVCGPLGHSFADARFFRAESTNLSTDRPNR